MHVQWEQIMDNKIQKEQKAQLPLLKNQIRVLCIFLAQHHHLRGEQTT